MPQRGRKPAMRFGPVQEPWCPVAQVSRSARVAPRGPGRHPLSDLPTAMANLDREKPSSHAVVFAEHGQTGEPRPRVDTHLNPDDPRTIGGAVLEADHE